MWWKSNEQLLRAYSAANNLRHFRPAEFCSKDGKSGMPQIKAMLALDELREQWGHPIKLVSAYRSPEHNKAVGGSPNSYHMKGLAFDVSTKGWNQGDKLEFVVRARQHQFMGFGFYRSFIHIDGRSKLTFWEG
jgi:zinc D-Ala-D-Ala carboxypeptidase